MPNTPTSLDWNTFASAWVSAVERAVANVARTHGGETFYALAFHHGYAEAEGRIDPPCVALNGEAGFREMHPGKKPPFVLSGVRWNPPDWKWDDIDAENGLLQRYYRQLTRYATSSTPRHWDKVFGRYERMLVKVAKTLATRAGGREGAFDKLTMTDDFIVFVHDEARGLDAVRETVPRRTFARLFPAYAVEKSAREALALAPVENRATQLVARFGIFTGPITSENAQKELVRMGDRAVPALIAVLDHEKKGWQAAMTLAQIGAPGADAAVPALVQRVTEGADGPAMMWAARALGALGRNDELLALLDRKATLAPAVEGLVAGRPHTYRHLDAALSRRDPTLTKLIAAALRPGSAAYDKRVSDFEAIAGAVDSSHEVIRKDVAIALGDAALGERNRKRAVPLLVKMLDDEASEVRRLALLALGWCGRHATAELGRIRAMKDDSAKNVRDTIQGTVQRITGRR